MSMPFLKMTGAGNDFLVFDDRKGDCEGSSPERWVSLCARRTGVGADGILILHDSEIFDFRMVFLNADGAESQMCGNGARCIAWAAAVEKGLGHGLTVDSPKPEGWKLPEGIGSRQIWSITFEAADGRHDALGWERRAMVTLGSSSEPRDLTLETSEGAVSGALLNVGVPHFVSLTDDPETVPLDSIGLWLRSHERLGPEGANVSFAAREPDEEGCYAIRTFERGVEGETLSCGTGAAAAAAVLAREGASPPVQIRARGGILRVHFIHGEQGIEYIWLEGPVRVIYRGVLADI